MADEQIESDSANAIAVIERDEDAMTAFATVGLGIDTAVQVAKQLNDIVLKQKLSVQIGPKKHLLVEAWCTCASMCGLSPRTAWCKRITNDAGLVLGYEARVEVVRLASDAVIGAAETECWMDEKQGSRLRWTEKHAAKSMAQTRGTSKAIAQILRWIPILAGYSGTPAEEADSDNGQPPAHENPPHDRSAPRTAARADRVSKDDIASLLARWKKTRPPEEHDPKLWSAFVAESTNRIFDVPKIFAWTPLDIERVDLALTEKFDA